MAYPGEDYKMSNYGLKTYTPEQIKELWRENTEREIKIASQHNATKLADHRGHKPDLQVNYTYYNNKKKHDDVSVYDQTFHIVEGYNQKLKRDDLQHTNGLNVHDEETNKTIPVLSNTIYGSRLPLEHPTREHVRVAVVRREFYRSCGTNL